jgi:hypothetical protein
MLLFSQEGQMSDHKGAGPLVLGALPPVRAD